MLYFHNILLLGKINNFVNFVYYLINKLLRVIPFNNYYVIITFILYVIRICRCS